MGIFSYKPLGEGKGVREDEPELRSFFLFFSRFGRKAWQIMKLNILYILCCLPIITIGAATAGFTYVLKCYINDEQAFLLHDFFHAFKENFFKATGMFIINALGMYSFWLVYANYGKIPAFDSFLIPVAFVNCLFIVMSFYVYSMMVTYDIGFFGLIKNGLIFTLGKLFPNIIAGAVFIGVYYFAIFKFTIIGMILSLLGLPAIMWMFAIFYNRNYIKTLLEGDEDESKE